MRFIIAIVLVLVYVFISLATAKGINGVGVLVGYLLGGAIFAPALIAALFCIPKSGRNNKRFFKVFNIVLLLSVLGNIGNLTDIYGNPPKTLIGTNGAIQVTVPATWTGEQVPNENILLNIKSRSGLLNILVGYEQAGNDRLNLEHYAQAIGNNFELKAPDFESKSSINPCESTVFECVYQIGHTTTGEKGTSTVLASLKGVDGFYNFMAITNPGLLETYQKDIFSVLKSFKEVQ